MADAARHFDRDDIEIATGTKEGANDGERIAYGLHFRFAGAANSDEDFFHQRMIWHRDSSMLREAPQSRLGTSAFSSAAASKYRGARFPSAIPVSSTRRIRISRISRERHA
jgi:hypothetical protein